MAVEPVELEPGVVYRRYAAAMLSDSTVGIRATGGDGTGGIPLDVLAVLIAIALAGVGVWAVRRAPAATESGASPEGPGGGRPGPEPSPTPEAPLDADTRERILLSIARIDERIEATEDAAELGRLRDQREALVLRLRGG